MLYNQKLLKSCQLSNMCCCPTYWGRRTSKNNSGSTSDVSLSHGGLIVPRQSFVAMSHSRNPCWREALRKERYFSHQGTKPPGVCLHDSCEEEKGLSNHNNHHPAVSAAAQPTRSHQISSVLQIRSLVKTRWDSIADEFAVSALECAEQANCSVLLIIDFSHTSSMGALSL